MLIDWNRLSYAHCTCTGKWSPANQNDYEEDKITSVMYTTDIPNCRINHTENRVLVSHWRINCSVFAALNKEGRPTGMIIASFMR